MAHTQTQAKSMLITPTTDMLAEYQSDVIHGTWKFTPAGDGRIGITFDELKRLAVDLQRWNHGFGEFIQLLIFEAAKGEFGLSMTYKLGVHDLDIVKKYQSGESEAHVLDRYFDFMQRRAGAAYRGYEGFRSHVLASKKPVDIMVYTMPGAPQMLITQGERIDNTARYIWLISAKGKVTTYDYMCDGTFEEIDWSADIDIALNYHAAKPYLEAVYIDERFPDDEVARLVQQLHDSWGKNVVQSQLSATAVVSLKPTEKFDSRS